MLSDDETYKIIRDEIQPIALELNTKLFELFNKSVGLIGPQGFSGGYGNTNYVYELICGSKSFLEGISKKQNQLSIRERPWK